MRENIWLKVCASWPRAKYFPVQYDHFFSFSFFWWSEDICVEALLHFVRIFKEPMFSYNSFAKPFWRPTIHHGNRTHCLNVCFHSFSRKHFVATKLFRIVIAGPYAFLLGLYVFFWPYHLDAYGPHTGTFFLWFSKEMCTGPYGSYDQKVSSSLSLMVQLSDWMALKKYKFGTRI